MSDDENDDYCGTCAQPGTNDNPLVCCDGCSGAWHVNQSCMGYGNRPIFTGYSLMKFFSAICCAHPLWVIQKTVLDNFECDKTAKLVSDMLETGQKQSLWTPPQHFHNMSIKDRLASVQQLWYSDPSKHTHIVVASLKGTVDLKPNAWFGSNIISFITGTPMFIFPLEPDVMDLVSKHASEIGKRPYQAWMSLYANVKEALKKGGKGYNIYGKFLTLNDLRVVPQFEHSSVACIKLDEGYYTRCLCNQESIRYVYMRQIGRFCFVTGETCNAYTDKSSVGTDVPVWASNAKHILQKGMDDGYVAWKPFAEEDDDEAVDDEDNDDDDDDEYEEEEDSDNSDDDDDEYEEEVSDEEDDDEDEERRVRPRREC